MSISIEIPDIDRIRSSFGDHAQVLDTELRKAETTGLQLLRDAARSNAQRFATDGRLSGSVRYDTIAGGLSGVMGSVAATADSIEEGRKPGEAVKVGLLLGWLNRKGIVAPAAAAAGATQNIRTHRVSNRKKGGVNKGQLALAWKLRMAIITHGTKPHPFIAPAAKSAELRITDLFNAAVTKALEKLAHK